MRDPKETNQKKLKRPTQDRDSPDYKEYLNELPDMAPGVRSYGQKIAELAHNGKIRPEALRQIKDTLKDPNKMDQDINGVKPYRDFMEALIKGRFPNKSEFALRFLRSLNGGEKEKEYAREFLKELSKESSSALTDRKQKEALKKLTELREEDLAQKTISETSSATRTVTESAGISSMVEKASKTVRSNYRVEAAPEKLIEELDRMEIEESELGEKANQTLHRLRFAEKAAKPDENLIERLHQELAKLDREIYQLQIKLRKPRLEYENWMTRNLARYKALEWFSKRAGLDAMTAERLRMWFFDLSSGKARVGEKSSLKLLGMDIDPVSGATKKKEGSIQITGLRFATDDRTGIEPDAAGELVFEYINEKGETKVEGYKNFLQIITAFEGYEAIDSLDDLNNRSAEEFGYADIGVGQEFKTEVQVGFDEYGRPAKEEHSFKIEGIDERKKTITLDRTVTKTPRQWIEFSVDNSLYFDRKQRDFTFGEFAKFLKQHNYERNAHIDETEAMCERAIAIEDAKSDEFMSGSSELSKERNARLRASSKTKVDLPKKDEEKEVLFIDKNNLLRWGKLKIEKGDDDMDYYVLKESRHYFRDGDATVDNLLAAGVPSDFASTQRAVSNWEEGYNYFGATRTLTPMELTRMVRDGLITNAPSTRPTDNGKWEIAQDPNRVAAMEMQDKLAFDEEEEEEEEAARAAAHSRAGAKAKHAVAAHPAEHAAEEHGHEEGHGGGHEEHGAHGGHEEHGAKKKYYEEALPLDAVKKSGGMKYGDKNYLRALWTNTRFLSMNDCWKMGKSMYEYYDRRWERRQKDKFARVGEELPYFSPEMRRIVEATEHEEVHQYQEAFEHKGIYEIQYRLEHTSNKDEFKATLTTLSDKGQLRWDSIPLWRNINRFISPEKAIPIPSNGDPNTRVSPTDGRTGFSFLKGALDSIWGEGTYDGFYSKNKSAYSSNAKGFYEEGKELEGVDGGHGLRLSVLLQQHKNGIYVNPHEYEGLLLHSIEAGKSSMQAKIYYMIEGVAAANHSGRTIMSFDRIAHINSEMLSQFPILEYITARVPRGPEGKESYRFTLDDYKQWVHWFDAGNPHNFKPGKAVDEFMWNYVIPSDETENRINKALRNGEKLDHDDMFAYLPPANFQVVNDSCKATGGNKKFLTIEGYANVFPGFSQYMRSVAGMGRKVKLREAIKSYVRFEGIMTRRFQKSADDRDPYQRMSGSTLNNRTIVSDEPPQAFIDQINPAIQAIAAAYNDPKLNAIIAEIYHPEVDNIYSEEGKKQQQSMNLAFEQFNKIFDQVVKTDNGDKMEAVIKGANFTGMPNSMSDEEKAKRKAQFKDKTSLD